MSVLQRLSTTGYSSIDKNLDHIIKFINNLGIQGGSTTTTTTNEYHKKTNIGGDAIRVQNLSGILLPKGYLVKGSASSTEHGVTVLNEGDYEIIGAVWEDIPPYSTTGYVVISGPVDVYFNSNGATAGNFIRMSRSSDTVNTDDGKAQSDSVNIIDPIDRRGYVWSSRVGEGLARCVF